MPIITLQQRQRELGRIRLGHKVGAKGAPEKLDRFRFTSPSQGLIDAVAALYGGTVQPWTPQGGTGQFEVITDATRLPILLPPQPVSQFMELWSGGGCQRRCDGVRELLTDAPCMCPADLEERAAEAAKGRACKPTTRLNVVLRDVHGIGVWRLESHGWNAALELPQVAEFLAQATAQGAYLPAHLGLEERVQKKGGQTRRFMVPTIEVDVTPAQLLAGGGTIEVGSDARRRELSGSAPTALPAAGHRSLDDYRALCAGVSTLEELTALLRQAQADGDDSAQLREVFARRRGELEGPAAAPVQSTDPDVLWQAIVAACPVGWSLDDLEDRFTESTSGTAPGAADPEQLQAFLETLRGGVPA